MEMSIASGCFWQLMKLQNKKKQKIQDLASWEFLAWPPANCNSKCWPAKQRNQTELSCFAMLWNTHRKRAVGGVRHLGLPRILQKLSQKRPPGRANHVKAMVMWTNRFYLAGPLKNGGEGSVPAKVDLGWVTSWKQGEVTSPLGRSHSLRQRLAVLTVFIFLTASFQHKPSYRDTLMTGSVTAD